MKPTIPVQVRRLPHGIDNLPFYATAGAAGADVFAALDIQEPILIEPGRSALIPTGLQVAIPAGYEIQVRPRSGLALKHAVTVLNTPGTIDADYRGEIGVILINHGPTDFVVERGDRVAQLVIAPVSILRWVEAGELPATTRGEGGFGSTGSAGLAPLDPAGERLKALGAAFAYAPADSGPHGPSPLPTDDELDELATLALASASLEA